jgi:hypothetical protein
MNIVAADNDRRFLGSPHLPPLPFLSVNLSDSNVTVHVLHEFGHMNMFIELLVLLFRPLSRPEEGSSINYIVLP